MGRRKTLTDGNKGIEHRVGKVKQRHQLYVHFNLIFGDSDARAAIRATGGNWSRNGGVGSPAGSSKSDALSMNAAERVTVDREII